MGWVEISFLQKPVVKLIDMNVLIYPSLVFHTVWWFDCLGMIIWWIYCMIVFFAHCRSRVGKPEALVFTCKGPRGKYLYADTILWLEVFNGLDHYQILMGWVRSKPFWHNPIRPIKTLFNLLIRGKLESTNSSPKVQHCSCLEKILDLEQRCLTGRVDPMDQESG